MGWDRQEWLVPFKLTGHRDYAVRSVYGDTQRNGPVLVRLVNGIGDT